MERVTGLGGIFFKAEDPAKLKEWYNRHLGVSGMFKWKDEHAQEGLTVWEPFKKDTTYFDPSAQPFMINYRVANLEELLRVLKKEGVTLVGEMQTYSYGKFAWAMDPEGNKIELWEPIDEAS